MTANYFETLPNGCPPLDSLSVEGKAFYRIVKANQVESDDFFSHKKLGLWSDKTSKVSECIACAVSVWENINACKTIQKLPKNRSKKIVKMILNKTDGSVKQTMSVHHYSWWRSKAFAINDNITFQ